MQKLSTGFTGPRADKTKRSATSHKTKDCRWNKLRMMLKKSVVRILSRLSKQIGSERLHWLMVRKVNGNQYPFQKIDNLKKLGHQRRFHTFKINWIKYWLNSWDRKWLSKFNRESRASSESKQGLTSTTLAPLILSNRELYSQSKINRISNKHAQFHALVQNSGTRGERATTLTFCKSWEVQCTAKTLSQIRPTFLQRDWLTVTNKFSNQRSSKQKFWFKTIPLYQTLQFRKMLSRTSNLQT